MADRVILYHEPISNDLHIIIPAPSGRLPKESEDDWIARIVAKDVPSGVAFRVVDRSVIPTDRTYRNAWKDTGGTVTVDLPRARLLHMRRIRHARDRELTKLDALWMRAFSRGQTDLANQIEAKRKTLRQIPQVANLDSKATLAEVHDYWPEDLGERVNGVPQ